MLKNFNIIFLCCTAFATESKKCDCDIFQFYYSEDENINRTLTKQTAEINGRPFYLSFSDIILWNAEKQSWIGHGG